MLAGRVRDSFLVLAATGAAIAALELVGYAVFLMPLGRVTLGTECFAPPRSVEAHGWLVFLPANLLLLPAFVSLVFRTTRARRIRAASLGGSLVLFFGTLTWVHAELLSLAFETFGYALNPVGVGEPLAVSTEAVAVGLLCVAFLLDSEHALGRAVGLVALVGAAGAAWFSVELIRHPPHLYDEPILLGQRGALLAGVVGLIAVWVSKSAAVSWRSLVPASVAMLAALASVAATRGHAWDRSHPLAQLWDWGYPNVAELQPAVTRSRVCSDISAFRYIVTSKGIETNGRPLPLSEIESRLRRESEAWTYLHEQLGDAEHVSLEIVSDGSATPPVALVRMADAAGFDVLVGEQMTVSELTGARGWVTRNSRCAVPLRLRADGTPITQFRTWDELARAVETGTLVALE